MKRQFVSTKGDTWEWEETTEAAELSVNFINLSLLVTMKDHSMHILNQRNQMKDYDPLTPDEVNNAAKEFFPLFDIVHRNMPENCTVEDTIKVMETVCNMAQSVVHLIKAM